MIATPKQSSTAPVLNNQSAKRVLFNSSWLGLEQVAKIVSAILVTGFVARHLGPQKFGAMNYAAGIVALLAPIAGLGLTDVLAKRSIADPAREHVVLATAFRLRFTAGLLATLTVATLAAIVFRGEEWSWALLIISFTLVLGATGVYDTYFQIRLQHREVVRWRLAALLGGVLLRSLLLLFDASMEAFAGALAADALFASVATIWAMRGDPAARSFERFDGREARTLLAASWPLITAGLLVALYFRIEQFIVMGMLGGHAYGVYMAASRIANTANLVFPPILASVFPLLARRSEAREAQASRDDAVAPEFERVLSLLGPGSVLMGAGVAVAGLVMLYVVLGRAYDGAALPLLILSMGVPAVVSGGLRAHFFMIRGLNHLHNYAALWGLVVNAGLALVLTPRLGIAGAALSTTLGAYVTACGTGFFFSGCRQFAASQLRSFFAWRAFVREIKQLI